MRKQRALVTGAGGFIGHHLVKRLKSEGFWVRGVDLKDPEFESSPADEFYLMDLRDPAHATMACHHIDDVYELAADMGGMGFITTHVAELSANNARINLNMLDAARDNLVQRYLYSSSACVYPHGLQTNTDVAPLKEEDAIPAEPERGYGWEKLFAEQMTEYYESDYNLDTRIVRFHNVYGPLGTYDGGREKSPAALCRKIAKAKNPGVIDIWGDGEQVRTYTYIDDCVEGIRRVMESDYSKPLNIGTNEQISINGLAMIIARIAKKAIMINHVDGPQGVRGRASDNTRIKEVLNWEPKTSLVEGLEKTYAWINKQVNG